MIGSNSIQTLDPFFSTASNNLTVTTNMDYNTDDPLSPLLDSKSGSGNLSTQQ